MHRHASEQRTSASLVRKTVEGGKMTVRVGKGVQQLLSAFRLLTGHQDVTVELLWTLHALVKSSFIVGRAPLAQMFTHAREQCRPTP